ncbi:Na+/H+ antiporter NhaA [Rhodoblastus acidophilus]|uniref:Na(+)/H(+) antiporter NhaA n=1 Tax=Candidatus Rhodoblastus alkanivorans TaxID=2954117 RepID=A0ABS9Z202_9HYPH|nr:Na+/H+ antiporter NhaA [Candidatus Rhodoblastus alkanivorans]MCI4678162.1 Na+/H+ antiporter NhaA [Candidatus Rhodoblastus alkanivorans]MCI4681212.1 Na+/H+ antiporter NhaA [Candidatus Rhodoblastus alkanivorans]MDI4642255.1 Na+/H+ antiporter NhaA [Rhodoblastus acidophilus]
MNDTDDGAAPEFPKERIQVIAPPLQRFIHTETAGGLALLLAAITALALANSAFGPSFDSIWRTTIGLNVEDVAWAHSLRHWINDGLMTIFFFVVGLEIKREMVGAELRELKVATLPIAAAIGGMAVPAAIYLALSSFVLEANPQSPSGWGVVMATDIAFAVGCMALLGRRVPVRLRVFILALAIVDDIGAVVVIAAGYSQSLNLIPIAAALGGILLTTLMRWLGIRAIGAYWFVGVLTWAALHQSGVHPALAGVVIGLMTPARPWIENGRLDHFLKWALGVAPEALEPEFAQKPKPVRKKLARAATESLSPLQRLEDTLHPWSAFLVLPLFALANAGVAVSIGALSEPIAIAIVGGLALGKPIGIIASSWLAVKSGLARKPDDVTWPMVAAAGMLAGIGFTMSLFIANLAFDAEALQSAKVGVLAASLISGSLGLALLWMVTAKRA